VRVFDLTIRQTTGILLRLCRLGAVKGRAHSARHDIGVHTGQCHRNACSGSLLSMDENHVLMVAEVFRHDQALARKPGSWTT
jgi:hypothetical protein